MANARPTVERRQLGLALKGMRERAGKSQLEAGRSIGKDDSRISKIEDGLGTLNVEELEGLLDFYGAQGNKRDTIVVLGAQARKRQPRREWVDLLSDSFQRFADLEGAASKIYCYEFGIIPGLLQSLGYINALFAAADGIWWESSDAMRRNRADGRLRRQDAVWQAKKPKLLQFVVGEGVLDDLVGSSRVMEEQLQHLVQVIDSRPNTTIHLLPRTAANNPARGGGLTILEFDGSVPRIGFASVVHGPSAYYDDEEDTDVMLRVFRRLVDLSLSPEDTRKRIIEKMERL